MKFERIAVIVMDSVGIGELPDAALFGDVGSHTLGHIAREYESLSLPNLRSLGLDRIAPIHNWKESELANVKGYYGKMAEASVGKDTMTGHWELMGLHVQTPFQTFPEGFPEELIKEFEQKTGRKVIGNKPASGTEILVELGEEQMKTGAWIVYTSADSVFQLAAHEDVIPLEELYSACKIARELTMDMVGRVIARPYKGKPGAFERTTNRHDYALKPPSRTVLNELQDAGLATISVGKINDIFDGEGISQSYPTKGNADGISRTISLLKQSFNGLLFVNLVDFDSLYGHRRNPIGYGKALEEFDTAVPELIAQLGERDLLVITADHGNDPTHPGTDHTREYVPVLLYSPAFMASGKLPTRTSFSDLAATIAENFEVVIPDTGESFLALLK